MEEGIGDSNIAAMEGWPAAIRFGTTASDVLTDDGLAIHYYDVLQYANVKFGVKAKPVVKDVTFASVLILGARLLLRT